MFNMNIKEKKTQVQYLPGPKSETMIEDITEKIEIELKDLKGLEKEENIEDYLDQHGAVEVFLPIENMQIKTFPGELFEDGYQY